MRLLRRVCGLLARQRLQGEGGLDQRPYGHGPEIRHPGRLAAMPHLLDRRLCRRRSYPDGSHRPATLRATEKSSGSRCRVCPRERLVCPATSPARWTSTRSGAVRRRSTRLFERVSDRSSTMANSGKRRIVLAALAASSLLVAVLLGYDIARRASLPATQVAGSSAPTGSANPDSSANSLALSVFEPPRPLPEIRFQDDQGHDLTLADFRGRAVLLNLWATWCVPCRQEMPTLDRLEARLGGKDFLVIALSIDRKGVDAVRDFYREVGV